jgi:hypothetical protein
MGQLDEATFKRALDPCAKCGGASFEISAYLDRTLSVMLGEANGEGKWCYDGEKFIDGVFRIRCMACSAEPFASPDCPRCHAAGALAPALRAASRLVVPKRCPTCKSTEVTLVGFAPSTARTTDATSRPTTPLALALLDDPGFHVVAVACDVCDWAVVAEGCPICGAVPPLRPRP